MSKGETYKTWARDNREARNQAKSDARQQIREFLDTIKKSTPCVMCGYTDYRALVFHHRDPSTKELEIGKFISHGSLARVEEEVAKCDVICANCHAIIHHRDGDLSYYAIRRQKAAMNDEKGTNQHAISSQVDR